MALSKPPAVVVVGDLHANSPRGLMPPTFQLDSENVISANPVQQWLWAQWLDFWAYARSHFQIETVIVNGDIPNGINVRDVETLTTNESDQIRFGVEVLKPVQECANEGAEVWMVRGTPYHVGGAGSREETIAREIGAHRYANGRYSDYGRWLDWRGKYVHAAHHISIAPMYPHTALKKELNKYRQRAQERNRPMPHIAVRSHAHQSNHLETDDGRWIAVAPAWQMSTEFIHKIDPVAEPSIGGLIFWMDEDGQIFLKKKLYEPPAPPVHSVMTNSFARSNKSSGKAARSAASRKRS